MIVRLSEERAREILNLLWWVDGQRLFGPCSENLDEGGVCRVCRSVGSLERPLRAAEDRRRMRRALWRGFSRWAA